VESAGPGRGSTFHVEIPGLRRDDDGSCRGGDEDDH
jgi:hypothetical protein